MLVEEAFVDPHNFIPERWYSKPELVKDKRAHAPFSLGNVDLFRTRSLSWCFGTELIVA